MMGDCLISSQPEGSDAASWKKGGHHGRVRLHVCASASSFD
jgi:hypothetical protein